jgi:hypothetical protein
MWKTGMWQSVVALVGLLAARTAHAEAGDRWDGVMMAEQGGGALLGGSLGMLAGGALGLAVAPKSDKFLGGLGEAMLGGAIGGAVGITVGVQLVGDARGGNGHWAATAGGTLVGGVLTGLTASTYVEKLPWPVGVGLGFVTLLTPPIVAYHLTSDANASDHEARVMVPLLLGGF